MKDAILTVVAIGVIFVGLPVLILWLKDRGGLGGVIVRKTFGTLALLLGFAIIGWVIFNLFAPTREYNASYKGIFQIAVPLTMIWLGWRWLRRVPVEGSQYDSELTLVVRLSGDEYGGPTEREAVLALKHRLEERLAKENMGEIDGEEFGAGECSLFIQTNTPSQAEELLHQLMATQTPRMDYKVEIPERKQVKEAEQTPQP